MGLESPSSYSFFLSSSEAEELLSLQSELSDSESCGGSRQESAATLDTTTFTNTYSNCLYVHCRRQVLWLLILFLLLMSGAPDVVVVVVVVGEWRCQVGVVVRRWGGEVMVRWWGR
ncbi:hypothetical protein E2C01_011047 [Portunus trituberculatus]|uniref:Uncharacterized protein n=1 Tax=Portunus trituberculatus TaxID=210409 RepID=A0A5B7DA27_PORTR|nr:hypothetical protein [Portunus trituberculatus]